MNNDYDKEANMYAISHYLLSLGGIQRVTKKGNCVIEYKKHIYRFDDDWLNVDGMKQYKYFFFNLLAMLHGRKPCNFNHKETITLNPKEEDLKMNIRNRLVTDIMKTPAKKVSAKDTMSGNMPNTRALYNGTACSRHISSEEDTLKEIDRLVDLANSPDSGWSSGLKYDDPERQSKVLLDTALSMFGQLPEDIQNIIILCTAEDNRHGREIYYPAHSQSVMDYESHRNGTIYDVLHSEAFIDVSDIDNKPFYYMITNDGSGKMYTFDLSFSGLKNLVMNYCAIYGPVHADVTAAFYRIRKTMYGTTADLNLIYTGSDIGEVATLYETHQRYMSQIDNGKMILTTYLQNYRKCNMTIEEDILEVYEINDMINIAVEPRSAIIIFTGAMTSNEANTYVTVDVGYSNNIIKDIVEAIKKEYYTAYLKHVVK